MLKIIDNLQSVFGLNMQILMNNFKSRYLIALTIVVGFATWLVMCYSHYKSYWYDTIYRVETVDFNLLHHTLPITLSQLIIDNRSDQIQKVLDSSFGLFGLVVTDANGETILFKTNSVYHRISWQKNLSLGKLRELGDNFDYLTNPVPVGKFKEFVSPRDDRPAVDVGNYTQSSPVQVIGRVYYIRNISPGFINDLTNFLGGNIFDISQSKRGYLIISFCVTIFMGLIIALIYMRKNALELRKREIKAIAQELDIKKLALENIAKQVSQEKGRKLWLERQAKEMSKRTRKLKSALNELKVHFSRLNGIKIINDSSIVKENYDPNQLLDEACDLVPELADLASNLTNQASYLQEQCLDLEFRRLEMQKQVDKVFIRNSEYEKHNYLK